MPERKKDLFIPGGPLGASPPVLNAAWPSSSSSSSLLNRPTYTDLLVYKLHIPKQAKGLTRVVKYKRCPPPNPALAPRICSEGYDIRPYYRRTCILQSVTQGELQESFPVWVLLQNRSVSNNYKKLLSTCNRYVHSFRMKI